jgi:SRSO17 transposase
MQVRELKRLENFLTGLTASMGRRERRQWAGVYVRGLLLDGELIKSVEPMAARLGQSDQALQQFLEPEPLVGRCAAWKPSPKRRPPRRPAIGSSTLTSFPKAGTHSAGVQRQYCGALGARRLACQIAVSLHRAGKEAAQSQPLCWRLYLPESWTEDTTRRQRAGVPPKVTHQSKLELALELIDQALGWESPAAVVLADFGLRGQL